MYFLFSKQWKNRNKSGIQFRWGHLNDTQDDIIPLGERFSFNKMVRSAHFDDVNFLTISLCASTSGISVVNDYHEITMDPVVMLCAWSSMLQQQPIWKLTTMEESGAQIEILTKQLSTCSDLLLIIKQHLLPFKKYDSTEDTTKYQQQLRETLQTLHHSCHRKVELIVDSYVISSQCGVRYSRSGNQYTHHDLTNEIELSQLTTHRLIWEMTSGSPAYIVPDTTIMLPDQHVISFAEILTYLEQHLDEFDYYPLSEGMMLLLQRGLSKQKRWIHAYTITVPVHIFRFCKRVLYFNLDDPRCVLRNAQRKCVLSLPLPATHWDVIHEQSYCTLSLHRHIFAFGTHVTYLIDAETMSIVDRLSIQPMKNFNWIKLIHLPATNRVLQSSSDHDSPLRLWSFDNNQIQLLKTFPHLRLHDIKLFINSSLFINRQQIIDILLQIIPISVICDIIFEFAK
jgi:hypothetical protein